MKRFLLLPLLASLPFASANAQLLPDDLSPIGFINSFPQLEVDNQSFISVDGSNSYASDGDAVVATIDPASDISQGIKFAPYDQGGSGFQGFVDITSNPVVWVKLKGTVGEVLRVNLKNSSTYDFVNGYDYNQQISCSNFSWYKFDFSASTEDMDQISEIEIALNPDVQGAGSFTVDSLLVGATGISPSIPAPKSDFSWTADFNNEWWKFGQDDNTFSVANGELTANMVTSSSASSGVGFSIYLNSSNHWIDISDHPIIKVSIKGTDGDTIRVNLKNGPGNAFVDGYAYNVILDGGSDYKEYTFDFSTYQGDITQIGEVNVEHNPTATTAGTFMINSLTVGDVDAEACSGSGVTGIFKSAAQSTQLTAYPNPVGAESLKFEIEQNNLSLYNHMGQLINHYEAADEVDMSDLDSGVYYLSSEAGNLQVIRL